MKQICVIGVGYVGLVTGACFADLGNKVIALDINEQRIENLKKGILPIYEPGLEELVHRNVKAGRLSFTTSYVEAVKGAEFAFIAVGTPSGVKGEADLQYVESAAKAIAQNMTSPLIIINKSTVPVGTGDWVADIVKRAQPRPVDFSVVSCPEFLREGSAISDFMQPHRTVLGSMDREAANKVAQLHLPLRAPIVITDLRTAEMIKYASNAFLATKISFINEIANVCEEVGADVRTVADGMGLDHRIGPHFLQAGIGYGGSCFPKDVQALKQLAGNSGYHFQLLNAVIEVNHLQKRRVVAKLKQRLGSLRGLNVGILGLTFKPNTDDLREAASIVLAGRLVGEGANVTAYDPMVPAGPHPLFPGVTICEEASGVALDADALIIVTEWPEFARLDWPAVRGLMRRPLVIDGRNCLDPAAMAELGFEIEGVGIGRRPEVASPASDPAKP